MQRPRDRFKAAPQASHCGRPYRLPMTDMPKLDDWHTCMTAMRCRDATALRRAPPIGRARTVLCDYVLEGVRT